MYSGDDVVTTTAQKTFVAHEAEEPAYESGSVIVIDGEMLLRLWFGGAGGAVAILRSQDQVIFNCGDVEMAVESGFPSCCLRTVGGAPQPLTAGERVAAQAGLLGDDYDWHAPSTPSTPMPALRSDRRGAPVTPAALRQS